MVQFELQWHIGGISTDIFVYEKGEGNKTYQSTSKSQRLASWFVKKLNAWWCGIGSNIFFKYLEWQLSFCLYPRDTIWNNTITIKTFTFTFKDFFNTKWIEGCAEISFGLCSYSTKNYPSRKLEYLSPKTCCIASQGGKWKLFGIRIFPLS